MRLREIRRELAAIEDCRQALDALEARLIAERDTYTHKHKEPTLKLVKPNKGITVIADGTSCTCDPKLSNRTYCKDR